jgi:hypothetical protein
MRRALAVGFLLVATAIATASAGCGGSSGDRLASSGEVVNLRSVDQVRSAFTHDDGKARLVLLLSPT